eukprot:TRINITY_DN23467_c0_g1_i1.p1 TRINITY_DN23467_c0_g1~~TRINITY_DN23467_c0_g1_i1.p1  ORF type:complete len:306 (+),score=100.07 TRINITY_DN23467_c0_g1_i1:100-1017(+)
MHRLSDTDDEAMWDLEFEDEESFFDLLKSNEVELSTMSSYMKFIVSDSDMMEQELMPGMAEYKAGRLDALEGIRKALGTEKAKKKFMELLRKRRSRNASQDKGRKPKAEKTSKYNEHMQPAISKTNYAMLLQEQEAQRKVLQESDHRYRQMVDKYYDIQSFLNRRLSAICAMPGSPGLDSIQGLPDPFTNTYAGAKPNELVPLGAGAPNPLANPLNTSANALGPSNAPMLAPLKNAPTLPTYQGDVSTQAVIPEPLPTRLPPVPISKVRVPTPEPQSRRPRPALPTLPEIRPLQRKPKAPWTMML